MVQPIQRASAVGRERLAMMLAFVFPIATSACAGCPDERKREEPELPPLAQACTTTALPNCVFDPHLPTDPHGPGFHAGVGESREQRLARWLAQSCEFTCSHLLGAITLESCEPATQRADGVFRVTCNVKYDTCHDTRL